MKKKFPPFVHIWWVTFCTTKNVVTLLQPFYGVKENFFVFLQILTNVNQDHLHRLFLPLFLKREGILVPTKPQRLWELLFVSGEKPTPLPPSSKVTSEETEVERSLLNGILKIF